MRVAESAPRRGTLWSETATVHVRPLGSDPHCAFLAFTGSHGEAFSLPHSATIADWVTTLGQWGYHRIRTNAVTSSASSVLRDAGFSVVQELTLLTLSHWTPSPHNSREGSRPTKARRFGALGRGIRRDILNLDAHAFGVDWCLDDDLLHDALHATPRSQVFVIRYGGELQGFVVVGASGDTGYVQRLAVSGQHRNRGVGAALVGAAVSWTQKRACTQTVVNTEVGNLPALRLYEKIGFVSLPNRLAVLHKELR